MKKLATCAEVVTIYHGKDYEARALKVFGVSVTASTFDGPIKTMERRAKRINVEYRRALKTASLAALTAEQTT